MNSIMSGILHFLLSYNRFLIVTPLSVTFGIPFCLRQARIQYVYAPQLAVFTS